MRHRPVQFNDSVEYPDNGCAAPSLLEQLIDLGLPAENAKRAEAAILLAEMRAGREYVARLLSALPPSATVLAVRRAMLGTGRSLTQDAAIVKRSRSSLYREQQRVRKHAAAKAERPSK